MIHSRMNQWGFHSFQPTLRCPASICWCQSLMKPLNPETTYANFVLRSLQGSNKNEICDFYVSLNLSSWISILVGNIFNEGSVRGLVLLLLNLAWNVHHFSPICKTVGDVIVFPDAEESKPYSFKIQHQTAARSCFWTSISASITHLIYDIIQTEGPMPSHPHLLACSSANYLT